MVYWIILHRLPEMSSNKSAVRPRNSMTVYIKREIDLRHPTLIPRQISGWNK